MKTSYFGEKNNDRFYKKISLRVDTCRFRFTNSNWDYMWGEVVTLVS